VITLVAAAEILVLEDRVEIALDLGGLGTAAGSYQ
jgi:hypothetical protein